MRDPSAGRAEFGALVRMMIQCELSQGFAGTVNNPLNVAPAVSLIVSPHFALFRAACKLPPALTRMVAPGAGVFAKASGNKWREVAPDRRSHRPKWWKQPKWANPAF